ncbi:MAG: hypothetical protein K2Y22_04155 [Candidatus Obscuribacterales bacterium]|nr:hypothetical protein [Candidatus Obscuribacterales bacterium]
MIFSLTTPPDQEPLTVDEVKGFLHVDGDEEDAWFISAITEACEYVEELTERALFQQTRTYYLDEFPQGCDPIIRLPGAPIQSITWIKYLDSDGTEQTLSVADYRSDLISQVARIMPEYGKYWPTTRPVTNAVNIKVVCGYADVSDIPAKFKNAMKLHISTFYQNRGDFGSDGSGKPDLSAVDAMLFSERLRV